MLRNVKVHFRLTGVVQKRLCLSSLFSHKDLLAFPLCIYIDTLKLFSIFLFQVPTLSFSLLQINLWFNLCSFNIESQTYFPLYNLH